MSYEQKVWEFDIARFQRMRDMLENGCGESMRAYAIKSMQAIKSKYASLKNEEIPPPNPTQPERLEATDERRNETHAGALVSTALCRARSQLPMRVRARR